ncbi:MAG: hypothetical protein FWG88_07750 [Oscillospiraceae bacterium]|nr:hypothetical protein [Oscillospiraceae bacterium]
MSIKSIDNQIMVARTADFARDSSALQKKPEVAQDALAQREIINDAENQSKVAGTIDTEQVEMLPDGDGGGGAAYDDGSGYEDSEDSNPDLDFLVPPSKNIIDITI